MPKYYEEKEAGGRACSGVREDLRACLLESSCVVQEGKSPKLCLKEGHCRGLLVSFFECKRSMPGSDPLIRHSFFYVSWITEQDSEEERDTEAPYYMKQPSWVKLNALAPQINWTGIKRL